MQWAMEAFCDCVIDVMLQGIGVPLPPCCQGLAVAMVGDKRLSALPAQSVMLPALPHVDDCVTHL